jgi:hypothetical protein
MYWQMVTPAPTAVRMCETASVATARGGGGIVHGHGDLMVFFIMLLDKLVRPYWEVATEGAV